MITSESYAEAFTSGFMAVCHTLQRVVGVDFPTAEEFAQRGFVRGWERRHQFRGDSNIISWVTRIAINLYIASTRSAIVKHETQSTTNPEEVDFKLRSADPYNQMAKVEALCDVESVLMKFHRSADRRRIVRRYIIGFTEEEVSKMEGRTPQAVKLRTMRSIREVRTSLLTLAPSESRRRAEHRTTSKYAPGTRPADSRPLEAALASAAGSTCK